MEIVHHQSAFVSEILDGRADRLKNPAYRVLGTISNYNIHLNLAVLRQPNLSSGGGETLLLDTCLLHKFAPKENSIYEVFGDIEPVAGPALPLEFQGVGLDRRAKQLRLEARLFRCLDGVDLELYEQVELLRRKFT